MHSTQKKVYWKAVEQETAHSVSVCCTVRAASCNIQYTQAHRWSEVSFCRRTERSNVKITVSKVRVRLEFGLDLPIRIRVRVIMAVQVMLVVDKISNK